MGDRGDRTRPCPTGPAAGPKFVADVAPYENRKLLMLNAAHSALAYGGLSGGHPSCTRPSPTRTCSGTSARSGARRRRSCRLSMGRARAIRVFPHHAVRRCGNGAPPVADRHGRQRQAAATHPADPAASPVSGTGGGPGSRGLVANLTAPHRARRTAGRSIGGRAARPCMPMGTRPMLRAGARLPRRVGGRSSPASQGCASIPGRNHRIAFPVKPDKNGWDGKTPEDTVLPAPKGDRPGCSPVLAWTAAALCLLPMFAVAFAALTGGWEVTGRLAETVLPRYAGTTAILVVAVGLGTAIIGTSTAWLVTATRFPGHRILEVALALPLAFPAYVLAYAYTDFLDHPGIVQTTLRDLTGWGPRDYWFPEIRSTGGAAAMLTFVLYPYVYLLARAAFLRQSATAYIAARTLGAGPVGRVLQGLGAGGAPRHRGRSAAGADGDARGLRHRVLFRRPDLRHRHLPVSWFSLFDRGRRRSLRCVFWPWRWSSPRWNGGKGGFSGTTPPGGGSSGCSPWR
jgi:hypothetical protein